jgi:hypothetical protein
MPQIASRIAAMMARCLMVRAMYRIYLPPSIGEFSFSPVLLLMEGESSGEIDLKDVSETPVPLRYQRPGDYNNRKC